MLIVLGAGACLVLQIYQSIDKYVGYDTNTQLEYVTTGVPLDFPAVTICNANMFR